MTNRPELDSLLEQYGLTRELLDDKENDFWDGDTIPTEELVGMIAWRYVELGQAEYRVCEDGEIEFRYLGNE
jgi:hypothetical protein